MTLCGIIVCDKLLNPADTCSNF